MAQQRAPSQARGAKRYLRVLGRALRTKSVRFGMISPPAGTVSEGDSFLNGSKMSERLDAWKEKICTSH
jgi:hypothetical protein